jgi:hypothetical protein
MTTKPAPGEVLFHMADGTEYATLHADDFRKGMLDRDHAIDDLRTALREALERATACAPVDLLPELEPLWTVLDGPKHYDSELGNAKDG